jgi:Flp pilus assembly protein TadD
LDGRRGSDRIQGRSIAVAGGAVALVAIAAGVLVSRSLRAPDWARLPGAIAEVVARPSRASSSPETAPLPAFPHPEDRASYEQGRRLLAAGQAKRALGPLGDAARGLPQDPAVAHDYGLALVGAGEEDRGLFQLEHASRLAPGIQSYRLDLIRALLAAGRRGPAGRELQELLARDPTNQGAAEMLAGLAATTGSAGAPGAAPSSMDLGGAASGSGSPRPAPVGGAFTNEDLGRRPAAPTPSPISPSPAPPASPEPGH